MSKNISFVWLIDIAAKLPEMWYCDVLQTTNMLDSSLFISVMSTFLQYISMQSSSD